MAQTQAQAKAKMLLKFDDLKFVGNEFIAYSRDPLAPSGAPRLDASRVYAVFKAYDAYYVVYETEHVDFYKAYLAEKLPVDAQQIDKLTYEKEVIACPLCGREADWFTDDFVKCPRHGYVEGYAEKKIGPITWTPRAFDWNDVLVGKAEYEVVTEVNYSAILKHIINETFNYQKWIDSVKHVMTLTEDSEIKVLKLIRELDIKGIHFTEFIGYVGRYDEGIFDFYVGQLVISEFKGKRELWKIRNITREEFIELVNNMTDDEIMRILRCDGARFTLRILELLDIADAAIQRVKEKMKDVEVKPCRVKKEVKEEKKEVKENKKFTIKAKYPGICPVCKKEIRVEDDITKVNGKWVHATCA